MCAQILGSSRVRVSIRVSLVKLVCASGAICRISLWTELHSVWTEP